ncbi:hypothetical protein FOL47_000522 [Perkinsus chesapeaki]|uniref:Uncharacterized protein n=1 Tax=Perkinsus chesapeaki TaxID=330153 RepID=A0A7J6KVL8_PERCH|nr:hypothetical protein FOL47_000522 [Perkinsus chesapeaki]
MGIFQPSRKRLRTVLTDLSPMAIRHYRRICLELGISPPTLFYTSFKVDAKALRNFVVQGGPAEHLAAAKSRPHPTLVGPSLPSSLLAAIGVHAELSPDNLVHRRTEVRKLIGEKAIELAPEKDVVRSRMHPDVRRIVGGINLPLLDFLIKATGYTDLGLAQDLEKGFPVLGALPNIPGVFAEKSQKVNLGSAEESVPSRENFLSRSELLDKFLGLRDSFLGSIRSKPYEPKVWSQTLDEVTASTMKGPYTLKETASIYGDHVLARRFPVYQPGKVRLCDDYRRSLTNSATKFDQKITLPTHNTLCAAWRCYAATILTKL